MNEPRAVRAALACVAACTTAAALYALVRVVEGALVREPDPALVLFSEHAGFFWRCLTVAYAGGMAGFVAWLAAARRAERVARLLATLVTVAASLLALQALFVP